MCATTTLMNFQPAMEASSTFNMIMLKDQLFAQEESQHDMMCINKKRKQPQHSFFEAVQQAVNNTEDEDEDSSSCSSHTFDDAWASFLEPQSEETMSYEQQQQPMKKRRRTLGHGLVRSLNISSNLNTLELLQ